MDTPMIKTLTSVSLGLALIGFAPVAFAADNNPAAAAAGTYKNDPLHTSVTAKISHGGGLSNFTFRFTKTDITYTYDPAKPDATQVTAVIGAASVATDYERNATNKDFNAEVAGDRFLQSAKFPTFTFKSTSIKHNGPTGTMTGDFTMMGVTKPITLNVTYNGSAVAQNTPKMGFSATGVVKRSDFGFNAMIGPLGDDVHVSIETEMLLQK
jgi:polyisoprenoid-binding protein YceI